MLNKVIILMHLIDRCFQKMKAAMNLPTIVIAIYIAGFAATMALTVLNYKPDPVGNIPLALLAHIFWPIALLSIIIWVFIDSLRNELNRD